MKISLKVKAKASKNRLKKLAKNSYRADVTAPAHKSKANQAVIKLLAKQLNLKPNQIFIIKGHKSNQKIIRITKSQ